MKASSSIGNITQIAVRNHVDLQGIAVNDHHTEIVALAKAGVGVSRITTGSYAGDDSVNKAIAHSLGRTPYLVLLTDSNGQYLFSIFPAMSAVCYMRGQATGASGKHAVTAPDATNFSVGNATSYPQSANNTGYTYYWVAFG